MNYKMKVAMMLVAVCFTNFTVAQESRPELTEGPLNKCEKELRLVLPMMLDSDSRLKLDRKIWDQHALTDKERQEKEIQKWIGRGLDAERAREFAGRMGGNRNSSGLHDLLEDVSIKAQATGFSQSGSFRSFRGRNLEFSVLEEGDIVRLEATELDSPNRTLRVVDDDDGEFRVLLAADDYLLRVKQESGGPIRIAVIMDEDIFQVKVDSFVEFSEQHPQRCDYVLKLLANAGFDTPPLKTSPEVIAEVKKQLALLLTDEVDGEELFAALDSNEFQVREDAQKTLSEQFEFYEVPIRKKLGQEGITPQLKSMLTRIIDEATAEKGDTRVLNFITEQNLVSSPEFLRSLLKDATEEERQLIEKQLSNIK